jgi:hypothetical protein
MDPNTQNPQDPNAGVPPAPSQDGGLGGDNSGVPGQQPLGGDQGAMPPAAGGDQGETPAPSGDGEPAGGDETPAEGQDEQQPPATPGAQ